MFAPLEAMMGILMAGLSAGLVFALVNRWIGSWMRMNAVPELPSERRGNRDAGIASPLKQSPSSSRTPGARECWIVITLH